MLVVDGAGEREAGLLEDAGAGRPVQRGVPDEQGHAGRLPGERQERVDGGGRIPLPLARGDDRVPELDLAGSGEAAADVADDDAVVAPMDQERPQR